MVRLIIFCLFIISLIESQALAAIYDLDTNHTEVGFKAQHLGISHVRGRFNDFSGHFEFDEKSQKLKSVKATIKTASIWTAVKDRDDHLKSADFFEVAKFPEMKFESTKVSYEDNKPDKVEGKLTIKGVTKNVTLEVDYNGAVDDPWGNRVVAFEAETEINRRDFNINFDQKLTNGNFLVGDKIEIKIIGEAKLKKDGKKK